MRRLASLAVVSLIVACGGDGEPKGLGKRADPRALATALDKVAAMAPADVGRGLAQTVLTHCGDACACVRTAIDEPDGPACPSANATVPAAWPPVELAGRYLAEQVAMARGDDRARLIAALGRLQVIIPRVDTARWALATTTQQRPLSASRALIGLDREGLRTDAMMPIARFDERGARVEDAPPPPSIDAGSAGPDPFASLTGTGDIASGFDDLPIDPGIAGGGSAISWGDYAGQQSRRLLGAVGAHTDPGAPLVAADGAGPAFRLADAISEHGGTVAILAGGAIRELPITFGSGTPGDLIPAWLLIRTPDALTLVVGGVETERWPIAAGRYDTDAVRARLIQARSSGKVVAVEIADGTAAALIETVDLAIAAGARQVAVKVSEHLQGYGRLRASPHASVPYVALGQPSSVGDLDKVMIRRYIKRNIQKISYCYEKELIAKPGLEGTVTAQFFIAPTGLVASAAASGVDPAVSSCVAAVIKSIEFPRPRGGGGVQVNYPFRFRPA